MLLFFSLVSGLFLGWSLGANDASNLFGTAVGSRMVKFKTAAIVSSIFVILGAMLQGSGTTETLSELGSIDTLGGAFTVAICSAIIVTVMTKYKLPISTGQVIVGAIVGWCYYTSNPVGYGVLAQIVGSWVFSPVLGAIFSALLYLLVRKYIRSSKMHMLKMESIIRISLIVAGAFGAYSLGANNIANVMGVFVNSVSFSISIGAFTFTSTQVLFFVGALAISVGIFTYSKRVMDTIGNGILSMTPEMAIVVVLSQAIVLFVFSSTTLSNFVASIGLPAIPLVPVSSTQAVVGALIGVGLVKGVREIRMKTIGNIMLSWLLAPVISGVFTFVSLFFVQRVFDITVTNNINTVQEKIQHTQTAVNYDIPVNIHSGFGYILLIVAIIAFLVYIGIARTTNKEKAKEHEHKLKEQGQFSEYQKALTDIEVSTVQLENVKLATNLEEKKQQLVTYSLNLGEQRKYLESIAESLKLALDAADIDEKNGILREQLVELKQKLSFTDEVDAIYRQAEQVHSTFIEKLNSLFPDLTKNDKKLLVLLRIGLSSKEIAPLLNISVKSVEISRSRLRKKLKIDKDTGLFNYIKTI
jgi:Phosphate/sulphate permeases